KNDTVKKHHLADSLIYLDLISLKKDPLPINTLIDERYLIKQLIGFSKDNKNIYINVERKDSQINNSDVRVLKYTDEKVETHLSAEPALVQSKQLFGVYNLQRDSILFIEQSGESILSSNYLNTSSEYLVYSSRRG